MVRHQILHRYAFNGSSECAAVCPDSYSIMHRTGVCTVIDPVLAYPLVCPLHGGTCIGHVEMFDGNVLLPTFMTPGTQDRPHVLMVSKRAYVRHSITYDMYIKDVVQYMRGKSGIVRSINSMVIQGSMRMVISADAQSRAGTVSIPHYVASHTKALTNSNGTYMECTIQDGDYGILVRQPCMWSGGIQPVKIRVTQPDMGENAEWDVNSSMRLPISMCAPFAADYDGDEMSLFVVKDPDSISECRAFKWPYDVDSPYKPELNGDVMSSATHHSDRTSYNQAICTTVCWQDRQRGMRITRCHENWMTSRSAFISMNSAHTSVESFMDTAISLVSSTCSKSSLQSDVGATSRRSKLGSERITLDAVRLPLVKCNGYALRHIASLTQVPLVQHGWFGNPSMRAVSKLCASIMQITLKIKAIGSIQSLSPTLSLLEGSTSWIVMYENGDVHVRNSPHLNGYESVKCTCSLMDISNAPDTHKDRLVRAFVMMVLCETGRSLDRAEFWCLSTLVRHIVAHRLELHTGIRIETNCNYPELNMVQSFNARYVTMNTQQLVSPHALPSTTIECMMLGKFTDTPSIHPTL